MTNHLNILYTFEKTAQTWSSWDIKGYDMMVLKLTNIYVFLKHCICTYKLWMYILRVWPLLLMVKWTCRIVIINDWKRYKSVLCSTHVGDKFEFLRCFSFDRYVYADAESEADSSENIQLDYICHAGLKAGMDLYRHCVCPGSYLKYAFSLSKAKYDNRIGESPWRSWPI